MTPAPVPFRPFAKEATEASNPSVPGPRAETAAAPLAKGTPDRASDAIDVPRSMRCRACGHAAYFDAGLPYVNQTASFLRGHDCVLDSPSHTDPWLELA